MSGILCISFHEIKKNPLNVLLYSLIFSYNELCFIVQNDD